MHLHFSNRYNKEYRKLPTQIKERADDKIRLFVIDPFHSQLNNHPLDGEYKGHRSINITGDYRALFQTKGNICIFVRIGTHSELYE